jgi:hypothetical protein
VRRSLPRRLLVATIGAVTMTLATVTVLQLAASGPALALNGTQTRYEAEGGTFQGTVDNNWPGFSGTGFVNTTNAVGSFVQLAVNAPATGPATLVFNYANGTTANRPMDVVVNGTLAASALPFPPTGAFSTWNTSNFTATLRAGGNTIRAVSTTANGGPNLDYLDVVTGLVPLNQYDAERATISHGVVESDHAGFTGTGFVNYDNLIGSFVDFTVNVTQSGPAALRLRFANGTTVNRPMNITVNGAMAAANVSFAGTGDWANWVTLTITVNLNAGNDTIRATATTANGGPNLDHIMVG